MRNDRRRAVVAAHQDAQTDVCKFLWVVGLGAVWLRAVHIHFLFVSYITGLTQKTGSHDKLNGHR